MLSIILWNKHRGSYTKNSSIMLCDSIFTDKDTKTYRYELSDVCDLPQERSHVGKIGGVHPPFPPSFFPIPYPPVLPALPPSSPFLHPFLLPSRSLSLHSPSLPFLISGPHHLKPPCNLGSAVSSPMRPGGTRPPNDFGAFWRENRPLMRVNMQRCRKG